MSTLLRLWGRSRLSTVGCNLRASQFTPRVFPAVPSSTWLLIRQRYSSLVSQGQSHKHRKAVAFWLFGTAGLVWGTVAVGGFTRLSESGLSMVNWDLIRSMRPPLSEREWIDEFDKYKQFPEYRFKTGSDHGTPGEMSMEEFKLIWRTEYLHRMFGRTIGILFFLPAGYFWSRGWLDTVMKRRVCVAGALILTQGLVGWWMVKSGLDPSANSNPDVPRVSQYRLVTHLSLAFLLYSMLLWSGLSNYFGGPHNVRRRRGLTGGISHRYSNIAKIGRLRGMAHGSKALIFLTVVGGAFVAGLDAGLVYNTWPKFGDRWMPESMLSKDPKWRDPFENPTTAQLLHRNLAYLTVVSISLTWLFGRRMALSRRTKLALHGLMAMAYAQAALGVITLVNYVPVHIAVFHQSGSMALLSFALWLSHELRRVPK